MDNDTENPIDITRRVTILSLTCLLLAVTVLLMGRRIDNLESRITYLSGQVAAKKLKKIKREPIPVFVVDGKSYEKDREKVNTADAT